MKLILENWKNFVQQSKNDCGILYLKENETITEKSFTHQLSLISESNDEQVNEFLATWSESVDYALSQDVLEEGVMDIVKQAASILAKLGAKSWETVKGVSQKILGFVERFKENNPTIYKMIVGAVVAVLITGLFYLTAKSLDMNAVTTAMEQLANMQIPDVKISEIVRDFTSQGTVDALRDAYQQLQVHVGDYIAEMIKSDIDIVKKLGHELQDQFGYSVQKTSMENVWSSLIQNADAARGN
jgi:hypothetical protein